MSYPTQTLQSSQQIVVAINPATAENTPAHLDANPTFTIVPAGVCTVIFTGPTFVIVGVAAGSATITIADTSDGAALSETVQVVVEADPAVTFGLSFGTPVAQP